MTKSNKIKKWRNWSSVKRWISRNLASFMKKIN
jgi:hypothetical protein